MTRQRRSSFTSILVAGGLFSATAGLLLVWLARNQPRSGLDTAQRAESGSENRAESRPRVELATPVEGRAVATADEPAATESNQPTKGEPAPVTEHEFRIANMKQWLAEVESGKAGMPSESLSCLMCASIAEIMDSQGRGIPSEVGKRTAFPAPGSVERVFVYNGTTYIFPSWEFQEYEQYHALSSRGGAQHPFLHAQGDVARQPVSDEERSATIADIVARAHTALSLNK
jgi:hypothetical protein